MIFLLEAFSFLWFVSEIGGILVCVFHCCNKSHSHKFMVLLTTYGFNFPICPSGPRHSTHFVLYFSWLEVLIPKGWIFTSERGQSNAKFLVKFLSHLALWLLNLKLQCHLLILLFWTLAIYRSLPKYLINGLSWMFLFDLLKLFVPLSHPEQCGF